MLAIDTEGKNTCLTFFEKNNVTDRETRESFQTESSITLSTSTY